MSYVSRVPAYAYELPCGTDHRHRTYTPSVPDEDGTHWLYCRRCSLSHGLPTDELVEHRPQVPGPRARVFGDGELVRQMDKAILKDRVAARMRKTWNTVPAAEMAAELGVPVHLVRTVAEDLGIYKSASF